MNDLSSLNGKGSTITVDGTEYRLHPLTLDDHGDLQAWVDKQQPDPFVIVAQQIDSGRFSLEVQKFLARSALEVATRNRVLLGSPEADALLATGPGECEIFYLSLRKGDPTMTRERARAVYMQLGAQLRARAVSAADVIRGDEPDPKAPASGG